MTPTSEADLQLIEDLKDSNRIPFIPTEEQIRQECLNIQKGWSDEDFYLRAKYDHFDIYSDRRYEPDPVLLEEVNLSDMLGEGFSAYKFAASSYSPLSIKDC